MPTGSRTLSQAARTLGRGTSLHSFHSQVSLPRLCLCCVGLPGTSPSYWYQLLLRCASLWSAGGNQGGGAGAFRFCLRLSPWLRQACTAAEDMAEQRYCVDYAKRGTAGCKKCKEKIVKGMVRIGKIVPNPFTESGGDMKEWYHVKCMFEKLDKARATTKKIEDITDLEGWEELQDGEKELINKHISGETQGSTRVAFLLDSFPRHTLAAAQLCRHHTALTGVWVCPRDGWVGLLKPVPQPCRKGKK